MRTRLVLVGFFAAFTISATAQSADLGSEGKAWWAHVQFLADDKLEGRNVGTPGFDKAVEWMEKNAPQNEELRRFQGEAAELLRVK